jgi:hypothetical protein
MNHRTLLLLFIAALFGSPTAGFAEIRYPAGTTIAGAWQADSRITAERAVELLSDRFLRPRGDDEELDLSDEDIEALKYLIANRNEAIEEPAPEPDVRRFVGAIDEGTALSASAQTFFANLPPMMAVRLGATAVQPCVRQKTLVTAVKHVEDYGWTDVEIFGVAVFAVNLQYGYNSSDVIHGVFPFAYEIGYWDGLRCVLSGGIPKSQDELRVCGKERRWMLQGFSTHSLRANALHEVPGVAAASVAYLGAWATGQGGRFETNNQYHPVGESSWLLGASSQPMPSRVTAFLTNGTAGVNQQWLFNMIVSWDPNIVFYAGFNNVANTGSATLIYDGHGEGNPHSIGDFRVNRSMSLYHSPLPAC